MTALKQETAVNEMMVLSKQMENAGMGFHSIALLQLKSAKWREAEKEGRKWDKGKQVLEGSDLTNQGFQCQEN